MVLLAGRRMGVGPTDGRMDGRTGQDGTDLTDESHGSIRMDGWMGWIEWLGRTNGLTEGRMDRIGRTDRADGSGGACGRIGRMDRDLYWESDVMKSIQMATLQDALRIRITRAHDLGAWSRHTRAGSRI